MSNTESNQNSRSGWKKPSYRRPDGKIFEPNDETWLSSLATAPFSQSNGGLGLPDSRPDLDAAADFGRFLFHLYRKKGKSGDSALLDCGTFGVTLKEFLEQKERSWVLNSTAIDLESRETTGWSNKQRSEVALIEFERKAVIHFLAAIKVPRLFTDQYSPDLITDNRRRAMWKDAGMSWRKSKTHGSDKRWIRSRLLHKAISDGKPIHPNRIKLDELDPREREAAHMKAADLYPELFTGYYRPLIDQADPGDPVKVAAMWQDFDDHLKRRIRADRK